MSEFDNSTATIVSMLSYDLIESKPGLTPNEYTISGRDNKEFGLTVIPNNVHYLVNPDILSDAKDVRQIKVPVPAMELAQTIVSDYTSALIAVQYPDVVPGLFAIKGNYDDIRIVNAKFTTELRTAKECHLRWSEALVNMADDSWSKSRSPIVISDLQRSAAKELGYSRDWINPTPIELQTKCPVCRNTIIEGALKCAICGFVINKIEYDKLVGAAK